MESLSLLRRSFYCLLLICLIGLGLHPVLAATDTPPLSEAEYWNLARETRQAIDTLSNQSESNQRASLSALADRWEKARQVRLEDGALVDLDHTLLLNQLRAEKPDLSRLSDGLNALIAAHETPGKSSSQAYTGTLKQILAQPEFQWQSKQEPDWLSDLLNRFLKWLDSLTGGKTEASGPGSQTLQFLAIGAAIFVGLILAYILQGLFTDLASEADLNTENGAGDEPISAESALERAEGLSNQGDYRSAVRYLYLSALLLLDERGLLYYDRTRTNREYLRDLNSKPHIAVLLRSVIDVFDKVWYGFQPLNSETYKLYADQVNQLKEQK